MQRLKDISMGFVKDRFPVTTHMCLIYNSEKERKRIISKYIESGLLEKEKVVYLADDISRSEVASWLGELQIDMESDEVKRCLQIIEAENVYCSEGFFSPQKMIDALTAFYEQTQDMGFPTFRASGEMTWALKDFPGSDKLIEYEAKLNFLLDSHPFTALCQYDANKFDGNTIYEVLRVHPYMIVRGQLLSNPYFVPPQEYLELIGANA